MNSATRHPAHRIVTGQYRVLPWFQARWNLISNRAKALYVILWGICKITCKELWVWKGLIVAVVVFAIVASFALTDNFLSGPLAVLGPTYGFLVLNILSKLTDYSLFAATGIAWEKAQWKVRLNGQERPMTFLVLSTGLMGWVKILFRGLGSWNRSRSSPVDIARMNLFYHPRTLSGVRILLWIILQLPAVIFMTLVNTTTSYYPIQWTPISGGIGVYDSNLIVHDTSGLSFWVSAHALNILTDPTISKLVTPISEDCMKSASCASYLIPGGLNYVTPWPFTLVKDTSLSAFVTRNGPAYQIDTWEAPRGIAWGDGACSIWKGYSAFRLCFSSHGDSQIVAGLQACNAEVLRSGECNQTGGWDAYSGWSSFMSFYRRTATIAADRHTMVILDASDMGEPGIQRIQPADFEPALETMLCSWNNTGALASCTALEVRHQVTDTIAILLQNALAAPQLNTPRDYLHNIFAAPLYHFNPMSSGDPSPDSPQTGLPAENSLNGSLARPIRHLTLEAWTIYAYIAISGPILIFTFTYLVVTVKDDIPKTSEFPVVDALILRSKISGSLAHEQTLVETFDSVTQGDGDDILSRAERRVITQKKRATQQAGTRLQTV